jgi:hypothetical protein
MSDRQFVDPSGNAGVRRAMELNQYKQVGGVGLAAAVLIGFVVAAAIASVWSDWHRYGVVRDYLAGDPSVVDQDLYDADQIALATAWGYLIVLLVAVVVFLIWLRRARQNAEHLCHAPHRKVAGWVVLSWICPVVNLWFPFMIIDDVYRASRPGNPSDLFDLRSTPGSPLLGWWWALWLAGIVPNWIIVRILGDELTLDALRTIAVTGTISTAILAGAAVLIIMIMRQISGWQTPRWSMT